jgi:hypothetical protein
LATLRSPRPLSMWLGHLDISKWLSQWDSITPCFTTHVERTDGPLKELSFSLMSFTQQPILTACARGTKPRESSLPPQSQSSHNQHDDRDDDTLSTGHRHGGHTYLGACLSRHASCSITSSPTLEQRRQTINTKGQAVYHVLQQWCPLNQAEAPTDDTPATGLGPVCSGC